MENRLARATALMSRVALALLLGLVATTCGSGGSGSGSFDGEKSPYGARSATTKTNSSLRFSAGSLITSPAIQQTTTVVGQKTIGGKTYDRLATTNVSSPSEGGEYWIKENGDNTLDFAGVDLHSTIAAVILPPSSVTFDAPIHVNLDAPVGAAQAITVSGTLTPAGASTGSPIQATGSYTLADKGAVAATDMGPLAGCNHYTGNATSSSDAVPALLRGRPISAEVWYHPSFGVVAFKAPDLGLESTMADTVDCGTADASGFVTIRKVGVVTAASGAFELSSYSCSQNFDADKNTHAQMLLEMRWLDETQAKTTTQPTVTTSFETVFGIFPHMVVQSPLSVLHPEENGKGFVYWIAYVNQAAKNESSNGISYGITVSGPSLTSGVRTSARVHYKKWP